MKKKFYDKNGELSLYSFYCGYVQREEKNNMKKMLFMEHSTFHVKVYKFNGAFVDTIVWDTFYSLTEARKKFKSLSGSGAEVSSAVMVVLPSALGAAFASPIISYFSVV